MPDASLLRHPRSKSSLEKEVVHLPPLGGIKVESYTP